MSKSKSLLSILLLKKHELDHQTEFRNKEVDANMWSQSCMAAIYH